MLLTAVLCAAVICMTVAGSTEPDFAAFKAQYQKSFPSEAAEAQSAAQYAANMAKVQAMNDLEGDAVFGAVGVMTLAVV